MSDPLKTQSLDHVAIGTGLHLLLRLLRLLPRLQPVLAGKGLATVSTRPGNGAIEVLVRCNLYGPPASRTPRLPRWRFRYMRPRPAEEGRRIAFIGTKKAGII